jgi:hypothetical protein
MKQSANYSQKKGIHLLRELLPQLRAEFPALITD